MAYYFAVETEENSFRAINVKRCRSYRNVLNYYDIPLACTLKEINSITTTFKNEAELREKDNAINALTRQKASMNVKRQKSN